MFKDSFDRVGEEVSASVVIHEFEDGFAMRQCVTSWKAGDANGHHGYQRFDQVNEAETVLFSDLDDLPLTAMIITY